MLPFVLINKKSLINAKCVHSLNQWSRGRAWEWFSNIWRVVWFFLFFVVNAPHAELGSINRSLEEAEFSNGWSVKTCKSYTRKE